MLTLRGTRARGLAVVPMTGVYWTPATILRA